MSLAGGSVPPRKPWEVNRSVAATGPSPFRPPSSETDSTAAVVESAGVADPADKNGITSSMRNGLQSSFPTPSYGGAGYSMPSYNQYNNSAYGMTPPYGSTYNSYNRGYGVNSSGMYGGGYGSYGGGMYGSNYGGGMYGSPYGMGMGTGTGTGMGMGMGAPGLFQSGAEDPNNPFGSAGPPSFWQSMLHKMHWMVVVFGNVTSLISENTQTFNLIITALFQFSERSGLLAGFVLKLLRMWSRPKALPKASRVALLRSKNPATKNLATLQIEAPKNLRGTWDNVWTNGLTG